MTRTPPNSGTNNFGFFHDIARVYEGGFDPANRLDRYSGEEEFYVAVRETGQREQEEEDEYKRTHTSKACFSGVQKHAEPVETHGVYTCYMCSYIVPYSYTQMCPACMRGTYTTSDNSPKKTNRMMVPTWMMSTRMASTATKIA